jgi:hypothetical protein
MELLMITTTFNRPRDLGNDKMMIRTSTAGSLDHAKLLKAADLKTPAGRKTVRRFAERLLNLCDWFEQKQ